VLTRSIPQAWITGDDGPGEIVCRPCWFPVNYWPQFLGAIELLIDAKNWEQVGTDTPEDVAAAFFAGYNKTLEVETCDMVGMVYWWPAHSVPSHSLVCDGQAYQVVDYPKLYAIIGIAWGAAGPGTFRVPNLIDNFILGGDTGDVTDTGGEAEHTLSVSEMPAHSHSQTPHTTFLAQVGAGTLIHGPTVFPSQTGSTGGGDAHNNMPPWTKLAPMIRAK
jgi:microcystin-dependent protein